MKLGQLLDQLLESENASWLNVICEKTDPKLLRNMRSLIVTEPIMAFICNSIAMQISAYLDDTMDDEYAAMIQGEGEAFFEEVWKKLKKIGLATSKERICVPITIFKKHAAENLSYTTLETIQ